jgi:AcrR family transcriptional regulator
MPKHRITKRFERTSPAVALPARGGYRRRAMVQTPWGDSDRLRERRLAPGRNSSRDLARENQRRRLFAAMVGAVAERGYEATRVEDLVELSGVSRKAFYEHFECKRDCFLAVLGELMGDGVALVRGHYDGDGEWEPRVRAALEAIMALLEAQPAAARLCFVDAYAAGPEAMRLVEVAFDDFAALVGRGLDGMPERAGMPPEIVRAIVGGLRKVIHTRLHSGREETLAGLAEPLWQWGLSYYPPPEALRRPQRRASPEAGGGRHRGELDQAERIIRALAALAAENGYPAVTIAEIAERAGVSISTFYSYFANKEEALLAALDAGSAQMLAAMLPAYRRAPDWPRAVRMGIGATFAFGVTEPDYAHLGAIEVYEAGRRALEQRDQIMEGLQSLIEPGYEYAPDASPIAAEAIAGAIYALIYDQVKAGGPASLPEIAPLATYVVLCPFIGPSEACEVANGDGRRH